LVVEVLDRAAVLERDRVAPGAVRGDQPLADHAAVPSARHLHALADLDPSRLLPHQRPIASTWNLRMAGSLRRRATKRAAPPGGISCGARQREEERREPTSRQGTTSAAALDSTASPRSVLAVSAIFPGASCHMSVVIVSPGKTTPEKRTSNDFMRAGSSRQYAFSTARP